MTKRLFGLTFISALALAGCNRAEPGAVSSSSDKPGQVSDAGSDVDPRPDHPVAFNAPSGSLVSSQEVPLLEQINRENTRVVAAALPCMVRITATSPVDPHMHLFGKLPFQFHFGPDSSHSHPFPINEPSYGSGVIISPDGYIVTNYHVVADAANIEVQLHDERSLPARVIASDAMVDVAVLKIAATDLSALPWGNSDKVQVGEQVFAIGDPFNLNDSVSKGIISAKGRSLPDSITYEDYLQTDAEINPGNSGGALINIRGELVGINAAIASTTGRNMGVGFAIPSNFVRYAVEGLLKNGKLVRGYLGVRLPSSIDEGVTAQLGIDNDEGALLAGVQEKSPADQAQLHPVDFITEVDGHKIESVPRLRLIVAQIPVGKKVVVNYIRAGAPRSTTLEIAEAPKDAEQEFHDVAIDHDASQLTPSPPNLPSTADNVLGGLQVTDLTDSARTKFGVEDSVTAGVVISAVQEGSLAEARGILIGDVIELASARRASIQSLTRANDFVKLASNLKPEQTVVLLVHHGKSSGLEDRSSSFVFLGPPPK